eukprot:5618022-Pyramimonas_sp.AAC.2
MTFGAGGRRVGSRGLRGGHRLRANRAGGVPAGHLPGPHVQGDTHGAGGGGRLPPLPVCELRVAGVRGVLA